MLGEDPGAAFSPQDPGSGIEFRLLRNQVAGTWSLLGAVSPLFQGAQSGRAPLSSRSA